MKRGSSGAQFASVLYMGSPAINKVGDERVGEQGAWLLAHPSPALPQIASVSKRSYIMEVLEDCKIGSIPPRTMVSSLSKHIWPMFSDPMVLTPLDPQVLKLKVYNLLEDHIDLNEHRSVYQAASRATSLITAAHENETFFPALAHGDPTWDNLMMRRDRFTNQMQFVFVDPLPARLYAPDWEEVDLGKIVQSLAGFEVCRYLGSDLVNDHTPVFDETQLREKMHETCRTPVQVELALSWGLIHVLRALPYMDENVRAVLISTTLQTITRAII